MDQIYEFLLANRLYFVGALGGLFLLGGKLKTLLLDLKGKIKLPSLVSKAGNPIDLELSDQDALRHLRNRAAALGNKDLISLIKEIDSRFYDIHAGVKNDK